MCFPKNHSRSNRSDNSQCPINRLVWGKYRTGEKNKGVRRQSRTPLPFFVNYETEIYFTINLSVLSLILTK